MDEIRKEILEVIESCDLCLEKVAYKIRLARCRRANIENPIQRETADEKIASLISRRKRLESTREELEKSLLCIDGLVNKW